MKPQTQRWMRAYHNWLGVFFAPGILFFGFTGLIQTIGLQDQRPVIGWIDVIANLHKHQTMAGHEHRPPPAGADRGAAKPAGPPREKHDEEGFVPLKPYTLLLSVALMISTTLGVLVAFADPRARRRTWTLLAAGTVLPLALLLL